MSLSGNQICSSVVMCMQSVIWMFVLLSCTFRVIWCDTCACFLQQGEILWGQVSPCTITSRCRCEDVGSIRV
jgi:hypothetical protein